MEKLLKKFSQLLNKIDIIETNIDEIKIKLYQKKELIQKIFYSIDKQYCGYITHYNICQYCSLNGIQINKQSEKIICFYFFKEKDKISYEEFLGKMEPKILSQKLEKCQEKQHNQDQIINCFIEMIKIIINQFSCLQSLKKELFQNRHFFKEYFYRKYGYINTLTKQNLKQYMVDHNIYHRNKYQKIHDYIFGVSQTEIQWQNFLQDKSNIDNQNINQNILTVDGVQLKQVQSEIIHQSEKKEDQIQSNQFNIDVQKQNKKEEQCEISLQSNIKQQKKSPNHKNKTQPSHEFPQQQQNQLHQAKPAQKKIHNRYSLSTQFSNVQAIIRKRNQTKQTVNNLKIKYQNLLTQYLHQNNPIKRSKNVVKTLSLRKYLPHDVQFRNQVQEKKFTQRSVNSYLTNRIATDYSTPCQTIDKKPNIQIPKQFISNIYTNRRLKRILSPPNNASISDNNIFLNTLMFHLPRY